MMMESLNIFNLLEKDDVEQIVNDPTGYAVVAQKYMGGVATSGFNEVQTFFEDGIRHVWRQNVHHPLAGICAMPIG